MRVLRAIALTAVPPTLAATPAQATPPPEIPVLTRTVSQVSGLNAKRKVSVVEVTGAQIDARALAVLDRDYPRDQQEYDQTLYRALGFLGPDEQLRPVLQARVRGARGFYDPVARRLYVRRGTNVRRTVLHELVRALEDQRFDLRRLASMRRGQRDATLAGNAAVEGSSRLFAAALGTSPGRTRLPSGPPIRRFLALEADQTRTAALRFATTLRAVGGNAAVHGALIRFPTTTSQILHVDAYLARREAAPIDLPTTLDGTTLERSDTFGELDVLSLLAANDVPRPDVAAAGWAGGRTGLYRDPAGRAPLALVLRWETERDALEWREAVQVYVNETFDAAEPGFPPVALCAGDLCWSLSRQIAFNRVGTLTALVLGPSGSATTALARTLVGAGTA